MLSGSEQTQSVPSKSSEQRQDARNLFDGRMDRLWFACGVKSDGQFAKVLGIKHQSVSSARSRRQLPFAWVVEISERFNVSSDWLLYGTGPTYREEEVRESQAALERSESQPKSGENARPFNAEIMRGVIAGVEMFLEAEQATLPHEKKAELILVLYEMFLDRGAVEQDMLHRYLKLVA